ncbi:MAG TPA: zf-HC2 domain-containing protein [Candidatus Tumulicola sp.]
MKYDHIEDRAALYALGALSDDERAAVDAHVRECSVCAQAVGEAENDVALMVASEPQDEAPAALDARIGRLLEARPIESARSRSYRPSWPYLAAVAAALVLGLLPSTYLWSANRSMDGTMVAQSDAMGRIAAMPHLTAHFKPTGSSAPADVMYAPDGSWYVVVVRGASKPLSVAWMHDGKQTMLGSAVPKGNVSMLYLPKSHRMDKLALMDGDRVVGEAALSWQS